MIHNPNYQNGKIYKIICEETENIYIGSTTQNIKYRLSHHKSEHNPTMSKSFINPKIELLEAYPCSSKRELCLREAHYIRTLECVNCSIPLRTQKEWIEDNKEHYEKRQKKYYELNRDSILKKANDYYRKNKRSGLIIMTAIRKMENERLKDKCDNEKIEKYKRKIYFHQNREKILKHNSTKTICECGKEISNRHLARHKKTNSHLKKIISCPSSSLKVVCLTSSELESGSEC